MKANEKTTVPTGVSRRTVVKGAAWAVPVVAVASAVPAMAASRECLVVEPSGTSCKYPGQSTDNIFGYKLALCFTNNCDVDVANLTVTLIRNNSGKALYEDLGLTTLLTYGPISITAGQTVCTTEKIAYTESSAAFLEVYYSVNGVPQPGYLSLKAPVTQCKV